MLHVKLTASTNLSFLKLFNVVRFPNFPCIGTWGQSGYCYAVQECLERGGTAYGACAYGFGVCCSLTASCGSVITFNGTYFSSPGFYSSSNLNASEESCAVQIMKQDKDICQIRLDFEEFDLERPTVGNCESERFIVTGQNANSMVPEICGLNSGQHLYIDIDMVPGPITLHVQTNGQRSSRWSMKITQIRCDDPSRAPQNCLQYYVGPSGNFSSFNYFESSLTPPRMGYMNNLDYTICFRKEAGFCSQTYSVPDDAPFVLENVDADNAPTVAETEAGVGVVECSMDYVLLGAVRFCGTRLNPDVGPNNPDVNAPVTDTTTGPFVARVVSDGALNARGFLLSYSQNKC
ncbi:uncharacterized protein LOC135399813 [Ornithodoros turicata]|uniref:uncharacterized protein LOC135399813 n=1 Tax=Ornithodoros turicata TaxID=34597 RepID=UPI003138E1C5